MKKIIEIISYLSLVLLVMAPVLFYAQTIDLPVCKTLMTVATATWFASALCWMGRDRQSEI